ncbi:DUF432 domain-containing protein [Nitrosopumilus sp.]|uniref:DUF432 domain-containing protein n=1 Tax=Nitrosopumilus sp. TaxID=2024843 RepID=UPI00260AE1C9|nr:DUF432 domain-containing protein [Nitrosopumilus sp.]
MSTDDSSNEFSKYGVYDVSERLDLFLPNISIKFERVSENAFFYSRADSEGNVSEKMIPAKSNQIQIELAPIRPLNHPARRTNYVFLKFDKEIYLSEDSAATIYVHCPIEIGIFLIHDQHRESLDWVTCNPLNSRFGLYGPPDTGTLCKLAEVSLATDMSDSISYVEGVMKILIENSLNTGQNFSKVIFPITDHSVYYDDSKAILDGLKVTLKKRAVVSVADVQPEKIQTDWIESPTWETFSKHTTVEMGLE